MTEFYKVEDTGRLKDGAILYRSEDKFTRKDINDVDVTISTNPKEFTAAELQSQINALTARIASYNTSRIKLLALQTEVGKLP